MKYKQDACYDMMRTDTYKIYRDASCLLL